MVELADKLNGWTASVYKFGCAFIHLSNFHDYQYRDPMLLISEEEREAIIKHVRIYHQYGLGENPSWQRLVPLLPRIFEKIADNLEVYVRSLEQQRLLSDI